MANYFWRIGPGGAHFIVEEQGLADVYLCSDANQCEFIGRRSMSDVAAAPMGGSLTPTTLGPGQHYRRMWHGQMHVTSRQFGTDDVERDAVRFARMLAELLRDIFRYLEPCTEHDAVFGHELRSLLILACTEVENSCKAVLKDNGAQPQPRPRRDGRHGAGRKGNFDIYDYSRLAAPLKLPEWRVSLSTRPKYGTFAPFEGWALGGTLDWYSAYNKTKHDRDGSLKQATLKHVIRATAALYILNVAQFGNHYREITTYFSPDEFVLRGPMPQWALSDSYIPPRVTSRGGTPQFLPPENWVAVNYPF